MPTCALCECEITQGEQDIHRDSREHIIPNSIGGRRAISGFICKACNDWTGHKWDAELELQLRPFSLLIRIERERGDTPSLKASTTAGEEIKITPDGLEHQKPVVKQTDNPDGTTTLNIKARSMNEARKILLELKRRKFPHIDVERELAGAKVEEAYLRGPVHHAIEFGGELAGRSVVKSCVAMAFASGVDWRLCGVALKYLRDPSEQACFGYFQTRDLVLGRVAGMPLHCIAIDARADRGSILAYAEYYGAFRIVSLLGNDYEGPTTKQVYAVDPRNGVEQSVSIDIDFTDDDINKIYEYEHVTKEHSERIFGEVLGPAVEASFSREQQRLAEVAWEEALKACGAKAGDEMSDELAARMSQEIAKRITPFIIHRLRPIR